MKYAEAVDQIGLEIECTLSEFNESGSHVSPSNVEDLDDIIELKPQMDVVRTAIYLLEEAKKDQSRKRYHKVCLSFQFPLHHSQFANQNVNLIFSYFMVASLRVIDAYHVFCILLVHFSGLNQSQYNEVVSNIYGQISYQKNLLSGLDQQLLISLVLIETTRGTVVASNLCDVC